MSALEDFARTRGYLIRTGCGPRGDFEPIREFVLSSAHIAEIASDQQTVAQLQARVAELEAALADEREVHVSVSSASDDELTKTRDALRRLEVSANSVAYCYRHRPENFAGALLALEDDAAFAREVSCDQP